MNWELNVLTIFLLAVALSMDTFAVSVANGMSLQTRVVKTAVYSGLMFGLCQGVMPLIGYLAGNSFRRVIESYDHWIALILLGVIGIKMIKEALNNPDPGLDARQGIPLRALAVQAVATSIDALAVGVGLGVMQADLLTTAGMIAATTFVFSFTGVMIGRRFGSILRNKAEIIGGVLLILIGVKIVLEHTGVLIL